MTFHTEGSELGSDLGGYSHSVHEASLWIVEAAIVINAATQLQKGTLYMLSRNKFQGLQVHYDWGEGSTL